MAFAFGFPYSFVHAIQLQEFAIVLPDFLSNMAGIPITGQAIGVVWLLVQGDVIRAFELDDIFAMGLVSIISSSVGVLEQAQAQLFARTTQSLDVFDLSFDFGEVTHVIYGLMVWLVTVIGCLPHILTKESGGDSGIHRSG